MHENRSPWLHQLNLQREAKKLTEDVSTDVVIVGAGIAGISTAFFILRETDKNVVLVDADRVAHGASGHNGGHMVTYFEKQLYEIAEMFGVKMATEGQKAIEETWALFDLMYTEAGLNIPVARFTGYTGLTGYQHVLECLENNRCRKEGEINFERLQIADDAKFLREIPEKYAGLYELTAREKIMECLETTDDSYVALLSSQKGCANSALICNEIADYLSRKYPERFTLFEKTPIKKIVMEENYGILDAITHTITAIDVVLCTNGFEHIEIFAKGGLSINRKFHENLEGYIGYMSAYLEKMNKPPIAISYIQNPDTGLASDELNYFYLTRRQYEYEKGVEHNLISVGGPGNFVEQKHLYDKKALLTHEIIGEIDSFVKKTYKLHPNKKIEHTFSWHGLMGYTKNRIRLIGPEKEDHNLFYNLGCNGVGLMPSIYGGWKVAKLLAGELFSPSIFDPE